MVLSVSKIADRALSRPDAATRRLERFGTDLVDEFDRSGAGGIERDVIEGAGARTQADVRRIGSEASTQVGKSFNSARGTLERRQRALGQNTTDRERRSQQRRVGLAQVLSNVDARNRALESDQSRREAVRTSAGGLRDMIDQSALTGISSTARAEASREVDFIRRKAQHEQEKAAGLGALAGIATSFIPGGALLAPMVSGAVTKAAS